MPRFERSKEKKGKRRRDVPAKGRSKRKGTSDDAAKGNFDKFMSKRGSTRGRQARARADAGKTTVTCASCGERCQVPFKPTSNKPVYCNACYGSKDKGAQDSLSNRDLDVINEKLNKIMKALNIR